MLLIHCPAAGADELVPERRIRSLHNTDTGIVMHVECYCGQRHTIRTGRLFTGPKTELDW